MSRKNNEQMKKKNINGIQNNLQELKDKMSFDYLENNTSIFAKGGNQQTPDQIKENLKRYIDSWIIPLINETIDKSFDK